VRHLAVANGPLAHDKSFYCADFYTIVAPEARDASGMVNLTAGFLPAHESRRRDCEILRTGARTRRRPYPGLIRFASMSVNTWPSMRRPT